MWMLQFIPDSFLLMVVNGILISGAVLTFLSFFIINRILRWFPPLAVWLNLLQIISIATLLAGVYFKGSYQTESEWRAKVAEVEAKVKAAEEISKKENVKIVTKVVTKTQIVRTRGENIIKYVDREIVKYDSKFAPGGACEIPKEFIKAHNDAAEAPK
jgi:xanthine/uracil permease